MKPNITLLTIFLLLLSFGAFAQGTPCTAVDITGTSPLDPGGSAPSGSSVSDSGTALSLATHCDENNTASCTYYYYKITIPSGKKLDFTIPTTIGSDRDIEGSIYYSSDNTCNNLVFTAPIACENEGTDGDGAVNLSVTNSNSCPQDYWIRLSDFRCDLPNSWSISYTVANVTLPTHDDPTTTIPMMAPTAGSPATLSGLVITNGTHTNSTLSPCYNIPSPSNCSAPLSGDWAGGAGAEDIWVAVTVPASGGLYINQTSTGATAIAAYETTAGTGAGTAGAFDETTVFSQLGCDSDGNSNASYADGRLVLSCLTPGSVILLRLWDDSNDGNATIGLTVTDLADSPLNNGDEPYEAINLVVGAPAVAVAITAGVHTETKSFPTPSCGNYTINALCEDLWYKITAPSKPFAITVSGSGLNVGLAVYTSVNDDPCHSSFGQIACTTATNPSLNMTPGGTYSAGDILYLRVWDYDCDDNRTFNLEAETTPVLLNSANNGKTFNLECGTSCLFYDSGGKGNTDGNNDYSSGENNTVTFCASAGNVVRLSFRNMFNSTVSTGTIYRPTGDGTHALDVDAGGQNNPLPAYHGDLADYLTFYDGNSTGASVIAVYTGETLSYPSPGTIVSSGECLTVNFKTSQQVIEEGWEAVVECISDVTPTSLSIPAAGTTFTDDTYNNFLPSTNIVPNDHYIVTYCPSDPEYCAFVGDPNGFLSTLRLNQNVDYLYVYNGNDDTNSPIAIFTGSGDDVLSATENITRITGVTAFRDYTPANTDGCLTFKLVSNNVTNYPDWTTVTGFSLPISMQECDLGNGGGTNCATATQITENGYWAATSVDDTGNGYDATYNPTGTDLAEVSGNYTINCPDAVVSGAFSEITRLENTVWYSLVTPDICEELDVIMFVDYLSCQNERTEDNGIQFTMWQGTVGAGDLPCPNPGSLIDRNANFGTISSGASSAFDMFGCFDKLTAGTGVDITGLSSNTEYIIMVDGYTGQHCFFDIYVELFPNTITNPKVDGISAPLHFCTGSTIASELSVETKDTVKFVYATTAYTSLAAAQAAATGTQAYGTTTLLGTRNALPSGTVGVEEATISLQGMNFPANNTCDIRVYNVYAIAKRAPSGGYSNGSDATATDCFPFVATQVVIYPMPTINVTNNCTSVTFSATCGGSGSINNFTLVADGVTIPDGSQGSPIDYTGLKETGAVIAYSLRYEGLPPSIASPACTISGNSAPLINCPPLPIELLYFKGEERGRTTLLNWRTETETNSSHFVVERSFDGNRFYPIGNVSAKGNSSLPQQYEFLDKAPRTGGNYYRLKLVDNDGTFEYSRTINLNIKQGRLSSKAYPSPTSGELTVEASETIIGIQIVDMSGKTIISLHGQNTTTLPLDVSKLPDGIYHLRVQSETEIDVVKFIKE